MAPRHHTVPQLYLRGFANAAEQVTLVSRDDLGHSFRLAVRKAVSEVGFYRIETEDLALEEDRVTHDPEAVEAALSTLESALAPVLERVIAQGFEGADDWVWYRLIQFTALQTVRGRRWRNDVAAAGTHAAQMMVLANLDEARLREWLQDEGRAADDDAVSAFVESLSSSAFPRLVPPQALLVQESLKMAFGDPATGKPGLERFLVGKKLDLIRTEHTAVLASDEPVCWWAPGDGPVGYASAQIVWVPLSPRVILQFSDRNFDADSSGLPTSPDSLAEFVNARVAAQGERWIVHHPDDTPLEGVSLPGREEWVNELVDVDESGDERRELYVRRRRPSA